MIVGHRVSGCVDLGKPFMSGAGVWGHKCPQIADLRLPVPALTTALEKLRIS